jgi:hypothetical protein
MMNKATLVLVAAGLVLGIASPAFADCLESGAAERVLITAPVGLMRRLSPITTPIMGQSVIRASRRLMNLGDLQGGVACARIGLCNRRGSVVDRTTRFSKSASRTVRPRRPQCDICEGAHSGK